MKYYIISGEASGDLHGSKLVAQLIEKDKKAEIRAWGGDLMQNAGAILAKHYRDLAFMGFLEVAKNLSTILKNIRFCKADILAFQPDVLILIDYPGFNLRMAKFAKQKGFKVFYYISPKIWAWRSSRVKIIKKYVDKIFVIFPFEIDFYKKFQVDVEYVGNPLMDEFKNKKFNHNFREANNLSDKKIIALLPGSRIQEIKKILPQMLEILPNFFDYQFVIAGTNHLSKELYASKINGKKVKIVFNQTYDLLKNAHLALVASGTATLETAILNVPQIVCYKSSPLSIWIGRMVIQIKYISLVNLIRDKMVLTELIQNDFNKTRLIKEIKAIEKGEKRLEMMEEYKLLNEQLGKAGVSEKLANSILNAIKNQ